MMGHSICFIEVIWTIIPKIIPFTPSYLEHWLVFVLESVCTVIRKVSGHSWDTELLTRAPDSSKSWGSVRCWVNNNSPRLPEVPGSPSVCRANKIMAVFHGITRMDDIWFYILFSSISVISGWWWGDSDEKPSAVEPYLRLKRFRPLGI